MGMSRPAYHSLYLSLQCQDQCRRRAAGTKVDSPCNDATPPVRHLGAKLFLPLEEISLPGFSEAEKSRESTSSLERVTSDGETAAYDEVEQWNKHFRERSGESHEKLRHSRDARLLY